MAYTWAPTPVDVAMYVPERAQSDSSTFDQTTVPTADQVSALIDAICSVITADVGLIADTATAEIKAMAKRVAALGVAADIELSYTSEEADEKGGRAKQFRDRYTEELKALRQAVDVGEGAVSPLPVFSFPNIADTTRSPIATTWDTRF